MSASPALSFSLLTLDLHDPIGTVLSLIVILLTVASCASIVAAFVLCLCSPSYSPMTSSSPYNLYADCTCLNPNEPFFGCSTHGEMEEGYVQHPSGDLVDHRSTRARSDAFSLVDTHSTPELFEEPSSPVLHLSVSSAPVPSLPTMEVEAPPHPPIAYLMSAEGRLANQELFEVGTGVSALGVHRRIRAGLNGFEGVIAVDVGCTPERYVLYVTIINRPLLANAIFEYLKPVLDQDLEDVVVRAYTGRSKGCRPSPLQRVI